MADLREQPSALRATVAQFRPEPALEQIRKRLVTGDYRRIVLTGMGGSCTVLHPANFRLLRSGFNSHIAETSELLYTTPELIAPETVLLVVSQSGASAETVRLLETTQRPFVAAITNTPGSPLHRRADCAILTHAGPEDGVACKTSVTAMAALHWTAVQLCGGDADAARKELEVLPEAFESYLARLNEHVEQLMEELRGIHSFFVTGRGDSLAPALLGGMLQKEAAHVHGEGMSSAALRHGPFEMLSPECFALVLEGATSVSQLHRKLVADVIVAGGRAALAGSTEESRGAFRLPPVPDNVRHIAELLPAQMATLALALLRGREPGKFEKITKVTTEE